ncbi:MAG: hypothetical protein L6Q99_08630 [Planctomycetes bacterium]|nr:hypothetical protein [Planctomycetota bacterium]
MSRLFALRPFASLAVGLLVASARADVTVLGKPGLGSFTTFQAAIDAASDGDTLLVAAGTYNGNFTIDAKSLTLLGSGVVQVNGKARVQNVAANVVVALVELRITGPNVSGSGAPLHALELTNCAGNLRLQDCTIVGGKPNDSFSGAGVCGDAVVATGCPRVMLVRSTVTGGYAGYFSGYQAVRGGNAITSTNSALALWSCTVRGGKGSDETWPSGGDGGDALALQGWGAFVSGGSIQGGSGGGGDYIGCTTSGNGGNGVVITGAQLDLLDVSVLAGGKGTFGPCGLGQDGEPLIASNAIVDVLQGLAREFDCQDRVVDGGALTWNFEGEPGDRVFMLQSAVPTFQLAPAIGIASVPWPWKLAVQPLGTLDATGKLTTFRGLGVYDGPLAGWHTTLQPLFVSTNGKKYLGTPRQVLVENL